MGTKVAVVLAILTVGYLEIKLIQFYQIIFPMIIVCTLLNGGKDSLMTVSFFGRKAKICHCLKNSSTHFTP